MCQTQKEYRLTIRLFHTLTKARQSVRYWPTSTKSHQAAKLIPKHVEITTEIYKTKRNNNNDSVVSIGTKGHLG